MPKSELSGELKVNSVIQLYGSAQAWNERATQFLQGSQAIATDQSCSPIDYTEPCCRQANLGYYGALLDAIEAANAHLPLDVTRVLKWRASLLDEMQVPQTSDLEEGDQQKIAIYLSSLNGKLISGIKNDTDLVMLLADIVCGVAAANLFRPLCQPMALLLMNYAATYVGQPLVVFAPEDREKFVAALNNPTLMRLLLSEKVREAVFKEGQLMTRVGGKYGTEWYKSPGSTAKKDLVIEWHELFKSIREWQKKI